jgi:transposase-like protein
LINIVVPDTTKKTLLPLIQKHVEKGSAMYTDDSCVYRGLHKEGYNHGYVCHKVKEYVDGVIHTQTLTVIGVF